MRQAPKGYPVLVEWEDASATPDGWQLIEDYEDLTSLGECRSVGWIVQKNKKYLTIAASLEHQENLATDGLTVARNMIRKITPLAPRARRKNNKKKKK